MHSIPVQVIVYRVLNYSTTNRDVYRKYKSEPKICTNCPNRHLCTKSKDCVKTVTRHIRKGYEEPADDARYTPIYLRMYKAGKKTIERVFADAKAQHGLRSLSKNPCFQEVKAGVFRQSEPDKIGLLAGYIFFVPS